MTDKEIIKALECCLSGKEELYKECPLNGKRYGDIDYLLEFALDLINRQQEQLEAAANGQETLQKALAEKNKELMDLNINLELLRIYGNKKLSYKIATLTAEKNRLTDMFGEYRQEAIRALDEKDIEIERLTTEKDQLIKTFSECQEEAVKDFAKAVIDGLTDGRISRGFDMVDFTNDYLRGKMAGDTE